MKALVIHPLFGLLGGGEYLCLNVIQALSEEGYKVSLMSCDYSANMLRDGFGSAGEEHVSEVFALPNLYPFGASVRKGFGLPVGLKQIAELRLKRRELGRICNSYDAIFHTQTSLWLVSHPHTFSFFYDPLDLSMVRRSIGRRLWSLSSAYHELLSQFLDNEKDVERAVNIPLSSSLQRFLQQAGYRHVDAVFPPCELNFRARRKVKRVIQVSRISPRKRIEEFFEIARLLPEFEFIIVGYSSPEERRLNPGYLEKIEAACVPNVRIIFDRIRNVPDLLEESTVYLYTSHEPGMNISMVQAAAAGCIPVAPNVGGGSEVVEALERGYTYSSPEEAVAAIRDLMTNERWTPAEVSNKAQMFSPSRFREKIGSIVKSDFSSS